MNISSVNSLGSVAAASVVDYSISPTVRIVTIVAFTALTILYMNYQNPAQKKLNLAIGAIGGTLAGTLGYALIEFRMKSRQLVLDQLQNNVAQGTPFSVLLPVFAVTVVLSVLATHFCTRS